MIPQEEMRGFFEQVYAVVRRIPPGRVMTYGQVSVQVSGIPTNAREVGWALRALPNGSDVPWQRVINAQGKISATGREHSARLQRRMLEDEGVVFDAKERIDLEKYGWNE